MHYSYQAWRVGNGRVVIYGTRANLDRLDLPHPSSTFRSSWVDIVLITTQHAAMPFRVPTLLISSLRHTVRRPNHVKTIAWSRFPSNKRTIIAAPKTGETLLQRRDDRELPQVISPWRPWLRTAPLFVLIMTISALGIFNYQKQNSSVVASTLYALRTSEAGRRELGDEIYFRDMWPWIWGELNQLHGRIDISYSVKGTRSSGVMRFKSVRKDRLSFVGCHCCSPL